MKKATILNFDQVDRLAKHCTENEQQNTVLEIAIETRAEIHERVRLPQIDAERTVIASRMVHNLKVVHLTAIEWAILRGHANTTPERLALVRATTAPSTNTNTSRAGSESVARAARSKRASPHVNGRPTASKQR